MATMEKPLPDEEYSEVDLNDDENNPPKNNKNRPVSSSDVSGLKIVTDKIKNVVADIPTVFSSKLSTANSSSTTSASDAAAENSVVNNEPNVIVKNGGEGADDEEENNLKKSIVVAPPLSNSNERIAAAVSSETNEQTFERLKIGIKDGTVSPKEVVNSVFQVLVGGPFDMENKFIIQNSKNIIKMVELLDVCPTSLQAEMWSVFIGIVRKSHTNLESCTDVGLITLVLDRLPHTDDVVADLLIEILGVLASYSIDVKEMKRFLRSLKVYEGRWPRHSAKLLYVLKQMPKKEGPDIFFSFSGGKRAGIQIPPLTKWPYQNGWTFATWLRMDPANAGNFEREMPYVYSFRTSKGVGYSCHFVGNCLVVTSLKTKAGKGYQLCVKYELQPRKWHHVVMVHNYSRWGRGNEVHCYIDGQHISTLDMAWAINTNDHYDRCYIGYSADEDKSSSFCGQMSAVYLFSEAITLQHVNSLYGLGPGYQSCFKFENETDIPPGYMKYLFDGKLANSLIFAYCPKNCDRQLCLESSPKENQSYFYHTPHALMMEGVRVVVTHSVYSTLHSIGGVQMLLPLFGELDLPQEKTNGEHAVDYTMCSTLLSVFAQLLEASPGIQQQILQNKAFLVIGNMLLKMSKEHIDEHVLDSVIEIAQFLLSLPSGIPLLKHIFDYILLNPALWIYTPAKLQIRLYTYLASEFVNHAQFYNNIRRVSTVMQMLHSLKYYYWLVDPSDRSGFNPRGKDALRPSTQDIVKIRSLIVLFIRKLMIKGENSSKDDELQAMLNFLTTVQEDDNLYDVLQAVINLVSEDPAAMVPGFDRKKGVCTVYKLLASPNELIRLPALKLIGYFLCRSTSKRKQDSMNPHNLFTLLTERLLLNASHISMTTYNTLFEILVENIQPDIVYSKHIDAPEHYYRFENPMILKVVANLISQSQPCAEVMDVKRAFLNDLMSMCANSRENRRTILQMSVWQEWLISLSHIYPKHDDEKMISMMVYQLFCMLLHHAIKLEYGGWRVWVDTLAIVHSKVSFEKFKAEMMETDVATTTTNKNIVRRSTRKKSEPYDGQNRLIESTVDPDVLQVVNDLIDDVSQDGLSSKSFRMSAKRRHDVRPPSVPKPVYRTPEFRWSHVHIRMLSDLLLSIETDVAAWKSSSSGVVIDHVNHSENAVFVVNTVHMISQLVDNLIMACGGLLPLLAAATSPNSELEIVDSTQQNLSMDVAVSFLIRFANLADVMVFATALNFSELEQEKNMPSGGILRQCLRLVATVAVRNCLAARAQLPDCSTTKTLPFERLSSKEQAIRALVEGIKDNEEVLSMLSQALQVQDPEQLLQEVDLNRLKAVIYRDIEETRQAQFLALAVVYFLSVLMVSRYRDILEPPPSPSPFFALNSPGFKADSSSSSDIVNGVDETRKQSTSADAKSTTESVDSAVSKGSETTTTANVEKSNKNESETPIDDSSIEKQSELTNDDEDTTSEREKDSSTPPAPAPPISSIQVEQASSSNTDTTDSGKHKPDDLPKGETSDLSIPKERQVTLTAKLRKALDTTAPFLREIMTDFHSFLHKTLLGTHGQEIMNDPRVLATLRNQQGSVVELVMLLCSQEWQTSLQKHAGLAFIELVNEGRLLAHATRDHIVRVANEADFILNRLRAEDVTKHAEFETVCAQSALNRKEEEKTCDLLITAARRRDALYANRINEKVLNILHSKHGAWSNVDQKRIYWKLDVWEDDSRRRKRLVPNPAGSSHPEATLKAAMEHGASEAEVDKAREALLEHLAAKNIVSPSVMLTNVTEELVDESDIAKWAEEKDFESDSTESVSFSAPAKLTAPGVTLPGILSITANELFFDCNEDDPEFKAQDPKVVRYCENLHGRWHFNEVRAIFLRRYMLQNTALEIFLASRTAVMFAFPDHNTVKKVVQYLPRVGVGVKYGLPQSRKASLMTSRQLFKHSDMPQKWQRREISNFDYLMFLNTISGRTYNDLNQYPVFPWIISNYESEELDLKQPSNFRDLSKPIGALNDARKAMFEERYNYWDHEKIPPFHYGTHYSTAAFTLNWLIRLEPFTTMFLHLQGGKFDHPDRTFHSIGESWKSCMRDTHDVKELIPEFYCLPEMFNNMNDYQFGKRDDSAVVNNVVLPPWAETPEHFVAVHRQALESDLVSCQLNQWIDLIFGYKQRGPEAVRSTNVFYYLTYEGALDVNSVDDIVMKQALENQIKNFGQTPAQLLNEPHPPRQSIMTISPMIFQPVSDDLCMVMKFISNSPVVHLSSNTYPQLQNPTVVSITASLGFSLNRWNHNYNGPVVSPGFNAPSPSQIQTKDGQVPNLPLTVDPLLAQGNPSVPVTRRHLGDVFDQRLAVQWNNFVCTVDSKFIIACGYPDYSFRVIETDMAKVRQVVYGHKNVITCLARSECNLASDCYIASGSLDCTVLLWHWNARAQAIAGEYSVTGESASPRAVLTGHDSEINCIVVSAEHGLIVSASKCGPVLIHTTQGDLLRCLDPPSCYVNPRILLMSRDCFVVVCFDKGDLCLFSAAGRLLKERKVEADKKTDTHIGCMTMSRDGEYIVAAGDSGSVMVYRLFDLELLYTYPACDSAVKSIALAQNHRFILAGLASGALVVFNVDFNKWHYNYQHRYGKI